MVEKGSDPNSFSIFFLYIFFLMLLQLLSLLLTQKSHLRNTECKTAFSIALEKGLDKKPFHQSSVHMKTSLWNSLLFQIKGKNSSSPPSQNVTVSSFSNIIYLSFHHSSWTNTCSYHHTSSYLTLPSHSLNGLSQMRQMFQSGLPGFPSTCLMKSGHLLH